MAGAGDSLCPSGGSVEGRLTAGTRCSEDGSGLCVSRSGELGSLSLFRGTAGGQADVSPRAATVTAELYIAHTETSADGRRSGLVGRNGLH